MYKSIIILLFTAIFLFLIQKKTIDFFNRYSKPSEKTLLLKNKMFGNKEILWMKIAGYGIIFFGLIIIMLIVILIYKYA